MVYFIWVIKNMELMCENKVKGVRLCKRKSFGKDPDHGWGILYEKKEDMAEAPAKGSNMGCLLGLAGNISDRGFRPIFRGT